MMGIFSFLFRSPRYLPDKDIKDKLVSPSSTAWEHSKNCTSCLHPIGFQEFMTGICLSCGGDIQILASGAAFRWIVRNGKWVQHQHYRGSDYLKTKQGRWVSPDIFDSEKAAT